MASTPTFTDTASGFAVPARLVYAGMGVLWLTAAGSLALIGCGGSGEKPSRTFKLEGAVRQDPDYARLRAILARLYPPLYETWAEARSGGPTGSIPATHWRETNTVKEQCPA